MTTWNYWADPKSLTEPGLEWGRSLIPEPTQGYLYFDHIPEKNKLFIENKLNTLSQSTSINLEYAFISPSGSSAVWTTYIRTLLRSQEPSLSGSQMELTPPREGAPLFSLLISPRFLRSCNTLMKKVEVKNEIRGRIFQGESRALRKAHQKSPAFIISFL